MTASRGRPFLLKDSKLTPRITETAKALRYLYLLLLALMATGLDQVTAFSAVAACMNNLGPGLGEVGSHSAGISGTAKWLLSLAMLLGRLEIFTLQVLLSPAFRRG